MIRWLGPSVVTVPTGEITLEECRDYIGPSSNNNRVRQDNLLDTLRASVPLIYESKLNRAMFSQRRQVQVVMEDHILSSVQLEPHTNIQIHRGETPSTLTTEIDDYTDIGTFVYFRSPIRVRDLTFLRFTYDAGFNPLPEDLKEAMLWTIHRSYERHRETINASGEVVINKRPTDGEVPRSVMHYIVTHDVASLAGGY